MGGADAVRRLGVTVIEFQSASFALGQEETPGSPPRATLSFGQITTDWSRRARVVEQENRAVTGAVTRVRQVVAGGIGMSVTGGTTNPMTVAALAGVYLDLRTQPQQLLLAAIDHGAGITVLPPISLRGETVDGVRYAVGPDTLQLWFDRPTGRLLATVQVTDDPILGDRRTTTWYTRWQEVEGSGGVWLPRQVDTEVNGRLLSHNVVTRARVESAPDPSIWNIPDDIAARAPRLAPDAPPPPPASVTVTLVELAPGVWRAEGGSHHSLVVDQGDRLLVVEAPQSTARSDAVLDTLTRRFPQKPVGLVVNTHHHWDHAGGLRGYLARGVPVLTHERNVEFVRGIAAAPKTVAPDALSRGTPSPPVRGVADTVTIGRGASQVFVAAIRSVHAEGILAAYVPSARLLFVSDVLTPGPTLAQAGSAEVLAFVRARGLAVERVVGGHGGVAPLADVERAAAGR
jgi:glyoxylase-like metal-dependent hydrolase (beta-lactamase superfamily II)